MIRSDRWIRGGIAAIVLTLSGPALGQDRTATLADIRQQMTVMSVELQNLRRELSTTGSGMTATQSAAPLERVDGLEKELRRLTAKTEELEFRIRKIVEDGTNRLDDLNFRVTELEGGDLGNLGRTEALGGGFPMPSTPIPMPEPTPELAVGEQADFDRAMELSQSGTPADAFAALNQFVDTYPRSPLSAEAHLYRGKALNKLGDLGNAGRAYLESYTQAEQSDPGLAAEALYNLGLTLSELKQVPEACITLGQVSAQFPGTTAATNAQTSLAGLTCP
ncbi:tetratricopeptide repeat protein [Pseudoruegeria sp. SK021]|uniref:tetratricopeptide repeat protein n=1 Tax=Pseudoruegeria sp. SK021 TaxID=1933035 RepID=UPI000A24FEF3|nr:tetratricopeptide repeat protein [Pseudoruegeria sp. SK021]OSP56532.1 hypothetical protein BV911_00785 [Pseudoruegeria sp. SK021]